MNATRKRLTTEELQAMLALEIERTGKGVWSDRRKTIEEMLKIKGVKI